MRCEVSTERCESDLKLFDAPLLPDDLDNKDSALGKRVPQADGSAGIHACCIDELFCRQYARMRAGKLGEDGQTPFA